MEHLGVLPDGELVIVHQLNEWDEQLGRWACTDVHPDGTPATVGTFLPFIWGYANWDKALDAFRSGEIRNINEMTRCWK